MNIVTTFHNLLKAIEARDYDEIGKKVHELDYLKQQGEDINVALYEANITPEELKTKYGVYLRDQHFVQLKDKLEELVHWDEACLDALNSRIRWHTECHTLDQMDENKWGIKKYKGECPSLRRLVHLLNNPNDEDRKELSQYAPYVDRVQSLINDHIERFQNHDTIYYENVKLTRPEYFFVYYCIYENPEKALTFTPIRQDLVYYILTGIALDDIDHNRGTKAYWKGILSKLQVPTSEPVYEAKDPYDNIVALVKDQLNAKYIFDLIGKPELGDRYNNEFMEAMRILQINKWKDVKPSFALYQQTYKDNIDPVFLIPNYYEKQEFNFLLKNIL